MSAAAGRQTLIILGARGDLAKRLLLPGLGGLVAASSLDGMTGGPPDSRPAAGRTR